MRHRKSFNHLGRTSAHRKAMLSNMACSLIMHKRIETTTAKAKALKRYIEPLITRSKDDSTHSRRVVFSYLQDKEAVTELFREVSAKVADRPGGYTRIIRLGNRLGDNADMCMMELVDFNENLLAEKAAAKKSSSRRRRGGSKKKVEETGAVETAVAEEVVDEAVEEAVAEAVVEEVVEEAVAEAVVEEAVEEAVAEEPVAEVEEPAAEAPTEGPEAIAEEPEEPAAEEEPTKDDDKKEA
jgi:large subunit ribosomal protein L17